MPAMSLLRAQPEVTLTRHDLQRLFAALPARPLTFSLPGKGAILHSTPAIGAAPGQYTKHFKLHGHQRGALAR